MDKQTFSSIQATTNTSRYAAAVFRKGIVLPAPSFCFCWCTFLSLCCCHFYKFLFPHIDLNLKGGPCVTVRFFFLIVQWLLWTGELHITPLTGILQMRPSFSYLDKADGKTREREAANEGASLCFSVYLAITDGCQLTGVLPCQQAAIPPRMKLRMKPKPSR